MLGGMVSRFILNIESKNSLINKTNMDATFLGHVHFIYLLQLEEDHFLS